MSGPVILPAAVGHAAMLPPELLSMIFKEGVYAWVCKSPEPDWAQLWAFLGSICLVSRSWSHAALNTPGIWTYLWNGDPDEIFPGNYRYDFRTCLDRAGALPVHVEARGTQYLVDMLEHINSVQKLDRVASLQLEDGDPEKYIDGSPIGDGVLARLLDFTCPNVKEIFMDLWENLPSATVVTLLQHHSTIQSLTMVCVLLSEGMIDMEPVVFPQLEKLQVLSTTKRDMDNVFRLVSSRALMELVIFLMEKVEHRDNEHDELTVRFEEDDWPCLRKLCVGGTVNAQEVIRLLALSPEVEVLELLHVWDHEFVFDDGELLEALCSNPFAEGGVIGPNIHTLHFEHFNSSLDAVDQWIDSRLNSSNQTRIREIGFTEDTLSEFPEEHVQRLAQRVNVVQWNAWTPRGV